MANEEIRKELFSLQDIKYRDFQVKLIPGSSKETMIGVRTPLLKSFAKRLCKKENSDLCEKFLHSLPHKYFDENQLHAFIISEQKDFNICIKLVEDFLPYVDNWATCDQLSPKVFKKNKKELLPYIYRWLDSESVHTYTVRFALGMLMHHFLDEDFLPEYLELACAASTRSEEYYIRMMVAWYFATALAKQWDASLPYIQKNRLDSWTHNKTIQKAVESFRITQEQKDLLKKLK
ncbi:MAG: DNA alkylation repair protein [Treponema sp.]|nr:DNA alkylation repair protein [Treponema sp.]